MKRSIFALLGLILMIAVNVRAEVPERAIEQVETSFVDADFTLAVIDAVDFETIKTPSPAFLASAYSLRKDEFSVVVKLPSGKDNDKRVTLYRRARDSLN